MNAKIKKILAIIGTAIAGVLLFVFRTVLQNNRDTADTVRNGVKKSKTTAKSARRTNQKLRDSVERNESIFEEVRKQKL